MNASDTHVTNTENQLTWSHLTVSIHDAYTGPNAWPYRYNCVRVSARYKILLGLIQA